MRFIALSVLIAASCGDSGPNDDPSAVGSDGFLIPLEDGRITNGTCVAEGELFRDTYDCAVVEGPGPGSEAGPRSKVTDADPARLQDPDAEWARAQVNACSCICCHSEGGRGAAWWAADFEPFWVDAATDSALQSLSGTEKEGGKGAWLNPATNHGFTREFGPPSTDPERMGAFYRRQLGYR